MKNGSAFLVSLAIFSLFWLPKAQSAQAPTPFGLEIGKASYDDALEFVQMRKWKYQEYEKKQFKLDYRIKTRDGGVKWVSEHGCGIFAEDGRLRHLEGFIIDITERKLAEESLKNNLIEKEALLMELHHRVKNNMQVISSILSIQSRHVSVENAHQAFADSRQRIRAMALIHERLYTSKDLGHIDINQYLRYLGDRLARLYGNIHRNITINIFFPHNSCFRNDFKFIGKNGAQHLFAFPVGRRGIHFMDTTTHGSTNYVFRFVSERSSGYVGNAIVRSKLGGTNNQFLTNTRIRAHRTLYIRLLPACVTWRY